MKYCISVLLLFLLLSLSCDKESSSDPVLYRLSGKITGDTDLVQVYVSNFDDPGIIWYYTIGDNGSWSTLKPPGNYQVSVELIDHDNSTLISVSPPIFNLFPLASDMLSLDQFIEATAPAPDEDDCN